MKALQIPLLPLRYPPRPPPPPPFSFSLRRSSASRWLNSRSAGVCERHCTIEFMKHVLPRFFSPLAWSGKDEELMQKEGRMPDLWLTFGKIFPACHKK